MNKFLLGLILAVVGVTAPISQAFALENLKNTEFALNHGDVFSPKHTLGYLTVTNKVQLMKCQYDFAKQGGGVSTVYLKAVDGSNCQVPSKAIVLDGIIDVITAPTSGGSATISVGVQSVGDIKAALAYGSWTGLLDVVPVSTAASSIKMTNPHSVTAAIAVAALTAGKFNVFIEYLLSE